jgi:hypothetical protein
MHKSCKWDWTQVIELVKFFPFKTKYKQKNDYT